MSVQAAQQGGISGSRELPATKLSVITLMHHNIPLCARRHSNRGDGRRGHPPKADCIRAAYRAYALFS
jgi:hypothetical protein